MINNVVFVSGVQQRGSVTCIQVSFFKFFSHLGCYRILREVSFYPKWVWFLSFFFFLTYLPLWQYKYISIRHSIIFHLKKFGHFYHLQTILKNSKLFLLLKRLREAVDLWTGIKVSNYRKGSGWLQSPLPCPMDLHCVLRSADCSDSFLINPL